MALFGVDIEFDPLKMVRDQFDCIFSLVSGVKDSLMSNITSVYDYLKNIYAEAAKQFEGVMGAVEAMGAEIRSVITGAIDGALSSIRSIYDTLSGSVMDIIEAVRNLPGTVRGIVSGLIADARKLIEDALTTMQATLMAVISPMADDVGAILDTLTKPEKFGDLFLKSLVAVW
jgi:phage-related protein